MNDHNFGLNQTTRAIFNGNEQHLLLLLPWLMIEDYTRKWYFCTKVIIEAWRTEEWERVSEWEFAVEMFVLNSYTHTYNHRYRAYRLIYSRLNCSTCQRNEAKFLHTKPIPNWQFITIFFHIIHILPRYKGKIYTNTLHWLPLCHATCHNKFKSVEQFVN